MRSGRPRRLVCGVGLNDYNGFTASTKGRIPEYDVWRTIIRRCYSKEHIDKFPTYKDAFVEDCLLKFTNFLDFSKTVKNFKRKGWDIDKDVLVRELGIHGYTRETIVYVPKDINYLILENDAIRGELPMGVAFCKQTGGYKASIKKFGKTFNIGRFDTVEEAERRYKAEKFDQIGIVAEMYRGIVDDRVYNALMGYHRERFV